MIKSWLKLTRYNKLDETDVAITVSGPEGLVKLRQPFSASVVGCMTWRPLTPPSLSVTSRNELQANHLSGLLVKEIACQVRCW